MTAAKLFALCGVALFSLGLFGAVAHRHLLRKIISLNVMGTGVFLTLVALADRTPAGRPDAAPQAMVLTGIVVAVSATALALALVRRLHRETGLTRLPDPHAD